MEYIIIIEDHGGRRIGFAKKGHLIYWLTMYRSKASVFQTRRDINECYAFLKKRAMTGGILKNTTFKIKQIPTC